MNRKSITKFRKRSHLILYISVLIILTAASLLYFNRDRIDDITGFRLKESLESEDNGYRTNLQFESDDLPKIVFVPHWLPQAQFAGYYIAKEKGFYASKGIDVEIIHPKASINNIQYLTDGSADIISSFLLSAMSYKLKGIDIVNIAQLSQHSAIMFVTKKNSGIKNIQDLENRSIGVWLSGFQETPMALIREYNLNVEWVPILSTVNLFLLDGIDALTVMWYNEYYQLYLSGIDHDELNHFFMSDYGYNIPEDGIYVLDDTYRQRGDELTKFVEATIEGWDYAAANKEYTVDLVVKLMQEANIPANKTHQSWMLEKVLETHCYKNKSIARTYLDKNDFNQALKIVNMHHQTDEHIYFDKFFKPVISINP